MKFEESPSIPGQALIGVGFENYRIDSRRLHFTESKALKLWGSTYLVVEIEIRPLKSKSHKQSFSANQHSYRTLCL